MDETGPQVSVVIPVYNGAQYLHLAIDSVLAQTYREFEIVVVDDGSTDETWSIIKTYMDAHPNHVRGIRKANGGISTALNAGILAAKGKYFAWLSHDDRFVRDKLKKQIDCLQRNPTVIGVYSDYSYINETNNCIGRVYAPWYPQSETLRHYLQNVFINGSTLVVERQCLIEMGLFDESLRYAQDALMWVHLLVHYSLAHIPEALTEYRLHPEQTTNKTKQQAIRRDNRAWLRAAVNRYTIQQLFPELNCAPVTAAKLAKAYIFLGEVFAIVYQLPMLSLAQFWKAWLAWPNLRNPVLVRTSRALFNGARMNIQKRLLKFHSSKNVPVSPKHPLVLDLRSWVEIVKFDSSASKD